MAVARSIVIFALLHFALATVPDVHEFIYEVQYGIKHEEVPQLVALLLQRGFYKEDNRTANLTGADLFNATNFGAITLEQLNKSIVAANVTLNRWDAYRELSGFARYPLYMEFINTVVNKTALQNALTVLGINVQEFNNYLMFTERSDVDFDVIFSKGDYSVENMGKALKLINKTESEVFDFAKVKVINKYAKRNLSEVLQKFNRGHNFLGHLFKENHVNSTAFTTGAFKLLLENFNASINTIEPLATAVGKNSFISSSNVYENFHSGSYKDFLTVFVHKPERSYSVNNMELYSNSYTNLTASTNIEKFATIATNYTSPVLSNCMYFSKDFSERFDKVENKFGQLEIIRSPATKYEAGSPLFCNSTLYGIAIRNTTNRIIFATFYRSIPAIVTTEPPHHPTTNKPKNFAVLSSETSIFIIIVTVSLLRLL